MTIHDHELVYQGSLLQRRFRVNGVEQLLQDLSRARTEIQSEITAKKACGEAFNVFELCGVGHYETTHSTILAEFLSPAGSHGTGDLLLKTFAERFNIGVYSQQAEVLIEQSEKIGGKSIGRFDILIKDSSTGHVCIIENKIFAGEQPEQLERYGTWLDQKSEEGWNAHLVFLTLDGHESATAVNNREYLRIAYATSQQPGEEHNDIVSWLRECARLTEGKPFVHSALLQYANHLENLATGDRAMSEKIIETLWSNMTAAEAVYENYVSACLRTANAILKEEVAGRLGGLWTTSEGCSWKSEQGVRFDPQEGEKLKGWIYVLFGETKLTACQIALFQECENPTPIRIDEEQKKKWEGQGWNVDCGDRSRYPLWRPVRCGVQMYENPDTYQCGACWGGEFFDRMNSDPAYHKKVVDEIVTGILELYEIQKELSEV